LLKEVFPKQLIKNSVSKESCALVQLNLEMADDFAEGILYACTAKNKVWEIRMK